MDVVSSLAGWSGSAAGVLLPFLFVLTVVIFVHELGHFSVARYFGVAIETFSIGFGPELVRWHDRHGTVWRIGALPLGGYVKFAGDQGPTSTPDEETLSHLDAEARKVNFHFKPVAQRAAVVAAGPVANFILAILVFTGIFWAIGQQVAPPVVEQVQPGSAAEAAGLAPRDRIVTIDGHAIASFFDMQRLVMSSPGQPLAIEVDRGGQTVTLTAIPQRREIKDRFGNVQTIGVLGIARSQNADDVHYVRLDPVSAVVAGAGEVWFIIERTLNYLTQVVKGAESGDQLSGPLRIAQVSGQAAEIGFLALVNLVAILSVSVGLINLFPIPLFDGGHLLYYAIEALRGRALSARSQEFGFRIGLVAVMSLMLFSTWNDLVHLRVVHFLSGLFS